MFCARSRSQSGSSTGTWLVAVPSRSQRSSYRCQIFRPVLARLTSALRLPAGAEGSVRQFSCAIHAAAQTWSRGTTKALGSLWDRRKQHKNEPLVFGRRELVDDAP
jgi:hypothetical protein